MLDQRTGSSAAGSGNTLALTLAATFKPSFAATQTLFGKASDNGNLNGGWQTLGTWRTATIVNTPPTADSVTPNAGLGTSQNFTFKYSSANGYSYLNVLYALVNGAFSGSGSCVSFYLAGNNALYLFNDAGTGVIGPLTLGASGTLQNAQCSIDGPGSSATGSGNTLALTLAVTFKPSFVGNQTLFGYAADSGNLTSGWQTLGTWRSSAPVKTPPTADSVTPNSGSGTTQSFTFKYSSVNGYGYLNTVHALYQRHRRQRERSCYVYYVAASNGLYLENDAGTGATGPLTPGASATLQNGQCSINGAGSSVAGSGNALTLIFAAAFKPAFNGTQTLFGKASDNGNLSGAWQTLGTWVSSSIVNTPPTADSVTPNAGSGISQNFTFKYSSVNGVSYLNTLHALIGQVDGGVSAAGACHVHYVAATNSLDLENDAGTGVAGTLTVGKAGTLQNSQCSIDVGASSISGSGNTLTLNLALTFSRRFSSGAARPSSATRRTTAI